MNQTVLGLDLGTNSIGWALLGLDENKRPINLVAQGVRIFQEAVEAKTGAPKNHARRAARAARKLIARRKQRKQKLTNLLVNAGLLPKDPTEQDKLLGSENPYVLRAKALDHPLSLHELGRILFHLNQHRGFQSNRKAKDEKEDGKVKAAITQLSQAILAANARTLGEFLATKATQRRRYTERAMYQAEFEEIWKAQATHYPAILTPALKVAIYNTIFHQRPLKIQKNLVGHCTFEPSRKRGSRAFLISQRFRILQDINHLHIQNPVTRDFRPLTAAERTKLLDLLGKQKTLSWDAARRKLGLHEGETFNLERGKKSHLLGNDTAITLRKTLDNHWDALTPEQQEALVIDLLTIDNEQGFLNRMAHHWKFRPEQAEALAKTELTPGYGRLSVKAMRRIMPYLETGMIYSEACAAAGYHHSQLPAKAPKNKLPLPPDLRNPVVSKALFETRKVINAIVREYGKPASIRVEMARDMKLSKRQKEELQKEQRQREKQNKLAEGKLKEAPFNIAQPTRADIQKYNLWQECKQVCPYTNTVISDSMLFSPEVDVEHILPYSRTWDDSYMNKTLCMAEFNRAQKKNNTPFEIFQHDEVGRLAMLARIKSLPWPKRRRFEQKEINTDEFANRQLSDTRHIATEVRDYLGHLGMPVQVSKGEATSALRHIWGLNRILSPQGNNEKNRADHRHHTLDAIVIALTDLRLLQQMSRITAGTGSGEGNIIKRMRGLPMPWERFYEDVATAIGNTMVSFAPTRNIAGALHESTAYGYSTHDQCFVYRKHLDGNLTLSQINAIRDDGIKALVKSRLMEFGDDPKRAFGENYPLYHKDGKTQIKSVRITANFNKSTTHPIKDKKGREYKYFKYGNNHHVEIIEHIPTGKRKSVFVTALEAARRARIAKLPIVQREGPWLHNGEILGDDWRFVMSLIANDTIAAEDKTGTKKIYRVQKMSAGKDFEITLKEPHEALSDSNANSLRIRSDNDLGRLAEKVSISPIGFVFPSRD